MGDVGTYSYVTLSPLAASTVKEPENYVVFRNQILLSSLESTSAEAATPDYFSLDVDDEPKDEAPVSTSEVASTPVTEKELERRLESGWFRANCRFKSPMLQLHKEILDFCEFLSPTPDEEASRNAAIERVSEVIKFIWPNCRVEVFGSFRTGLYLPSSDIDLVIIGSNIRTPQPGLQALSKALSQKSIAKKIQVIGKARVPIIKFVEKISNVQFDVSFDMDGGPKAAVYIKDAISKLPPLRPLCLILKVFLQQRELNEVYSGGIGSYALLAMLIAMLRNHEFQACTEHNLGILLVKFFELYALKLNTWDVGVSCNGRGSFFLKRSKGFQTEGRSFLISIEDPQAVFMAVIVICLFAEIVKAPENDVGKNSFNYFQIRSAFRMAFSTLTNVKMIMNLSPNRSILGTIIRPDAVLVERKGGTNGEVTFNGLLPGAGEPLQTQYDDKNDLHCNWQLNDDYVESPLPRGGERSENVGASSSGKKKRKAWREKSSGKAKDSGEKGWKKKRSWYLQDGV